jgi:hypothetical protein
MPRAHPRCVIEGFLREYRCLTRLYYTFCFKLATCVMHGELQVFDTLLQMSACMLPTPTTPPHSHTSGDLSDASQVCPSVPNACRHDDGKQSAPQLAGSSRSGYVHRQHCAPQRGALAGAGLCRNQLVKRWL